MTTVSPIPVHLMRPQRTRLRVRSGICWADAFTVMVGFAVTIVVTSYQFGRSNHTVYLLDAIHQMNPAVLANDWFTTKTFQYHAIFGLLTRALWGWVQPAFLVGYLGLAIGLHVAWFQLTRLLGGGRVSYLVSVMFLYLSGAGTALGVYTFLQDSAFLPSNVASVALLWGIVLWVRRRVTWAGAMFAIAAVFHLNYAVVAPALWGAMWLWDGWLSRRGDDVRPDGETEPIRPWHSRAMWIGTALAIVPAGVCVLLALRAMPRGGAAMPFNEFLDLYVHLRHPHHYDPFSWPAAIWVSFLWPMVFALLGARRVFRDPACSNPVVAAWRRAGMVFAFFMIVTGIAVAFAGWTFVDERLVQMSLFRFSIYPHLLGCIGAAVWLCEGKPLGRPTRWIVTTMLALGVTAAAVVAMRSGRLEAYAMSPAAMYQQINVTPIKILVGVAFVPLIVMLIDFGSHRRQQIYAAATVALMAVLLWGSNGGNYGLIQTPGDESFAKVTKWARNKANTPRDAVFVVPPDEETFRLAAMRAIVINYKGVPQTSRELGQWRDRLSDVLDLPDLRTLPRPMPATLAAMRRQYDELPPEHLVTVARKYGARYIIATHAMAYPQMKEVYVAMGEKDYFVYDLGEPGKP